VASTSAEASVRAILDAAVGPQRAGRFDLILAGDVVSRKKPAPDIYCLAIERLAVPPDEVLVVEDSRNGLLAALGASLRCLVTVSDYTADEEFDGAVMVVTSLGDPGGERARILANRSAATPGDWLTLRDMEACLRSQA
jgi:beta-phosphoglucomutase-like phosphatase (HAD superfamily)